MNWWIFFGSLALQILILANLHQVLNRVGPHEDRGFDVIIAIFISALLGKGAR